MVLLFPFSPLHVLKDIKSAVSREECPQVMVLLQTYVLCLRCTREGLAVAEFSSIVKLSRYYNGLYIFNMLTTLYGSLCIL